MLSFQSVNVVFISSGGQTGPSSLANFSKTAEQKNAKEVPYQMTGEERYNTFRARIGHLNLRIRYIKYTYSESTLDGQFKTLILSPEVTKTKGSKVVSDGVKRFWG